MTDEELKDDLRQKIIEAAEKAKAASSVINVPRDYIDIGKKLGVSSTFGMELRSAANKAYNEWKEKHDGK